MIIAQSTHDAIYWTHFKCNKLFTLSFTWRAAGSRSSPLVYNQVWPIFSQSWLLFLNFTRWQQCFVPKSNQRSDAGQAARAAGTGEEIRHQNSNDHCVNSQNEAFSYISWCPLVEAQESEKNNQQNGINKTQQATLMHDSNSGYQQLIQLNIFHGVLSSPENPSIQLQILPFWQHTI